LGVLIGFTGPIGAAALSVPLYFTQLPFGTEPIGTVSSSQTSSRIVVEALLAAFQLAQTRLSTFGRRVGFVAVIGLLANGVVGFIVAGLVMAAMLRRGAASRFATA
jgi:hypothetical protein